MPELEIINGPITVYWAPVGEAFTAIGSAPAGNWLKIGTSGDKNYSEDGVVVSMEKTVEYFRSLGSPFPRKGFITEADILVTVSMADMSLAQMRLALNQNVVTTSSPTDTIELDVGLDPSEIALMIRGEGKSPQLSGGAMQYQLNRVVEEGSRELAHIKGEPVMAELTFRVIYDDGVSNPAGALVVEIA